MVFPIAWIAALLALVTLPFLAAPPAAANCIISDLPDCTCYTPYTPWALTPVIGDVVGTARLTSGMKTSCARHRGQPYWQVQQLLVSPAGAHTHAHAFPDFVAENPAQAWCSETVGFWHVLARVPYGPAGYSTTGLPGARNHHPSPTMQNTDELRLYYLEEERLREEDGLPTRGMWVDGRETDYANFEPGVNGPCPGAYQQLEVGVDLPGFGWVWAGTGSSHSQVVDSMIVYRYNAGPVYRIDVRLIEGNVGSDSIPDTLGVKFLRSRIKNSTWYQNVIDFTRLGDEYLSSGRKIRGWGIDLDEDGDPIYDPDRIRTVTTYTFIGHPAPQPADTSDNAKINLFRIYHQQTGGNIFATSNSPQVHTGGTIAHPGNHWLIPPPPHPVNPVYIDIDLLANHPHRVRAVELDWKDGKAPPYYEVWWSSQAGPIHSRPVVRQTGAPPYPQGEVVPDRVAFAPDSGYVVRYARVCIPQWALLEPYEVVAFNYEFWTGTPPEDSGGAWPDEPDNEPPTNVGNEYEVAGAGPSGLQLLPNTPNPFRSTTTIMFDLPTQAGTLAASIEPVVRIVATDGRLVRQFVLPAPGLGRASVTWDGRDERGQLVASGTYLCEVSAGAASARRKITLLR